MSSDLAQQGNRFEVSKQLEILNTLVKEVDMFYVDSVEVDKMVRRGIDAMLKGLDPYTEYFPEQEMDNMKMLITGEYGRVWWKRSFLPWVVGWWGLPAGGSTPRERTCPGRAAGDSAPAGARGRAVVGHHPSYPSSTYFFHCKSSQKKSIYYF